MYVVTYVLKFKVKTLSDVWVRKESGAYAGNYVVAIFVNKTLLEYVSKSSGSSGSWDYQVLQNNKINQSVELPWVAASKNEKILSIFEKAVT